MLTDWPVTDRIYDKKGYSKPADLWSLGVVVFLMLGGRFPFLGGDAVSVAQEGREKKIRFTRKEPWTSVSDTGAWEARAYQSCTDYLSFCCAQPKIF